MPFYDYESYTKPLQWPYNLIYIIVPFNLIFDFIAIYYPDVRGSNFAITRGVFLILILAVFIRGLIISKLTKSVLLFIVYVAVLFPFSSDLFYSLSASLKIFITLMMLPIGYSYVRSEKQMYHLSISVFYLYAICAVGFLLYNIFEVGGFAYTSDVAFHAGVFEDNWNTLTYLLLLAPAYLLYEKRILKKYIFYVLFLVLLVILFVSFKRIAVTGIIFGYLIFIYNYRKYGKTFKYLLLTSIALLCVSPLFMDSLFVKYEARQYALNIEYMYEQEARSRETRFIWGEVFSFDNPMRSIFGGEAFNSAGLYADGMFGNRVIHVDYNLILFSTGIVGMLLYFDINI